MTAGDQPILSIRATVAADEAEAFIAAALHDIRVYLQEHDVAPAGPPFSICRSRGESVDVEAGWPVVQALGGTSRIHSGAVPGSFVGPERVAVGSDSTL